MKKLFVWIVVLALVGSAVFYGRGWLLQRQHADQPAYDTTPVERGDLVATFPATGTVEPEDPTDVGAQVAGRIVEFGKDNNGKPVDYTSPVTQGMLLAKIDDSTYKSDLEVSQANLKSSEADVERSKADLLELKSKQVQADRDWQRAQKLGPSDALAQTSYDSYRSASEVAAANEKVGEAAIKQAQASVDQAQAGVDRAKQNLGYCTINSPVTGVIIDRRVQIGQTVVASLNAPSLFLIGKDLRHVQVWVAVNEADIGNVYVGQPVGFEVDAFSGQQFSGTVSKIRLNATMTSNVVTYTVEVDTDNSDGRLLPYLTANAKFETGRATDALIVPNTALKFQPAEAGGDGEMGSTGAGARGGRTHASDDSTTGSGRGTGMGRHAGTDGNGGWKHRQNADAQSTATQTTAGQMAVIETNGYAPQAHTNGNANESHRSRVWVMSQGALKPIPVEMGVTNGTDTAVTSPDLHEGMEVVTGIRQDQSGGGPATATNPFMPQFPRGGGRSGGGGRRG